MRIGIDIRHLTDPQPAGVGGYTKALLEALFCLDQTNEYILFATGTPLALHRLPTFNAPNVRVTTLPVPNKIINALLWARVTTLEKLFSRQSIPLNVDLLFFPNLNFISTKLPYAIMAHDLSYKIFPEFFTLKSRIWHHAVRPESTFVNAAHILCPSESTKQDLANLYGIPTMKIHITPLAASSAIVPSASPGLPKHFLLSLSTIEPRKNHRSLIEAYEDYRDKTGDEIHLIIGGGAGWKSAPVFEAAKQSKYAKDIHLIGYVSAEQKTELYTKAQAFVYPSFYEGFGLPVLEAMSAGCPVITSHTSSLPELVQNAAILVDPYNINDITQAIRQLLSSDALKQGMIEHGKKRAKEFSWENTAKKTQEVLSTMI